MSAPYAIRSHGGKLAAFASALVLICALGAATPTQAFADDSPSVARIHAAGPVSQGMCQAALQLQSAIDACGQDILNEKNLEHQRRADAVAEQLRLDALNSKGEQMSLVHQTAAEEAARASEEVIADESVPQASAPGAQQQASASEQPSATAPADLRNTIYFNGEYVPFIQGSSEDIEAPRTAASTWFGDGSVSDGAHSYFIGHNPGMFSGVMDIQIGDEITVWDSQGDRRSYFVYDTLVIPNASNFYDYQNRLAPEGESITLQTCCGDNVNVRCVIAR